MPRPNRPRDVFAESHLARRIAMEREAATMTYDGLAKRMTDAGCPIQGSAIYKIEKGDPPRRIVVDELIAFAAVFNLTPQELLLPPEVAFEREAAELLLEWEQLEQEENSTRRRMREV